MNINHVSCTCKSCLRKSRYNNSYETVIYSQTCN